MRIALVSDTHFQRDDVLTLENWCAVSDWLRSETPDLAIHLGDITANGAHDALELHYAHDILRSTPGEMLFLPGNHDIGDHAPAGGIHPNEPIDRLHLDRYKAVFGPDRWSRVLSNWQIVGLNAQLLSTGLPEEAEQFAWLEDVVANGSGPLGLFLHKPLFRDHLDEDIVHTRYVPRQARRRLMAILGAGDLRFVIAGHTHQVRQIVADGVDHVWAPSTAFTLPDFLQEPIGGKAVGTMMLELGRDRHTFTNVIPKSLRPNDIMQFTHLYPELIDLQGASR